MLDRSFVKTNKHAFDIVSWRLIVIYFIVRLLLIAILDYTSRIEAFGAMLLLLMAWYISV